MLKAIVTIWSFAFGLILVAAFAGCGGDESCGTPVHYGATPDMAKAADGEAACPTSCGVCGAGESCFMSATPAAGVPPFCARSCNDTRDCKTGEKCVDLFATMRPAVCVSDTLPALCGGKTPANWVCDFALPTCIDADTLRVGYSERANRTCGYERVHCDNGCDDTTSPAHCK